MTKKTLYACIAGHLCFLTSCSRLIGLPAPPVRQDPYENLKLPATPAYPDLAVALLLSENTKNSIAYGRQGGQMAGVDVNPIHEQDIEMYRRNFKTVVKIDSLPEARTVGADLIIVIDRFVKAGFSLSMECSLILVDPDGREIDKISAQSDSSSVEASKRNSPSTILSETMKNLRTQLESGLRASEKLRAYAQSLARVAPAPTAQAGPETRPGAEQPANRSTIIVAVFDIHDASRKLDGDVLAQLTIYLGTQLTKSGTFKVIPMNQIRARLLDEKAGTYKKCYDESCQIELGKALSAQKSLATTLIQVGSQCAVTANLFDLKTETAEKGASVETGCLPDELLKAIRDIAQQLSQ